MADRNTVKCNFCNNQSSSSCSSRHIKIHAPTQASNDIRQMFFADGSSVLAAHNLQRAVAQDYTKRQVVSQASLVRFTESRCAENPLFSGIPVETLVEFGRLLLQTHGTTVDSGNLKSSFDLPPATAPPAPTLAPSSSSPATQPPTPAPSSVPATQPPTASPAPAPSSSVPATKRRAAKRRRSPSPAPCQSQPRPTPVFNNPYPPVPACCSDGSVSAALPYAPLPDFLDFPGDLSMLDSAPLSPTSLVAPSDTVRDSMIGADLLCESPTSKRARLVDPHLQYLEFELSR